MRANAAEHDDSEDDVDEQQEEEPDYEPEAHAGEVPDAEIPDDALDVSGPAEEQAFIQAREQERNAANAMQNQRRTHATARTIIADIKNSRK